jgi:hypothetical protein
LWYIAETIVRIFPAVFVALAALSGCATYGPVVDLRLAWRGVEASPHPSPDVARAFASSTLAFALRDVRPDPSSVGGYEETAMAIRTSDNVAAYCSARMGELLAHAGARFSASPTAVLEAELLEYRVIEGETFNGVVRIRAIVRGATGKSWTATYTGRSKRWGRTHNPVNFNEALSGALADVAQQLIDDGGFAEALGPSTGEPVPVPPPPPADPYPLPGQGQAPGASRS